MRQLTLYGHFCSHRDSIAIDVATDETGVGSRVVSGSIWNSIRKATSQISRDHAPLHYRLQDLERQAANLGRVCIKAYR